MKLEHRKQKLVPLPHFIIRFIKYGLLCLLLIVLSVGVGTVGYNMATDASWLDSFYMASMILTGMGSVIEMKTAEAKLFSSFYALYSGIAFLSVTAIFFAPIIHRLLHILQVETEDES